jgi:hypothetical protein
MADNNAVHEQILDRISELLKESGDHSREILRLAEAKAWLTSTAQPHGTGPS